MEELATDRLRPPWRPGAPPCEAGGTALKGRGWPLPALPFRAVPLSLHPLAPTGFHPSAPSPLSLFQVLPNTTQPEP